MSDEKEKKEMLERDSKELQRDKILDKDVNGKIYVIDANVGHGTRIFCISPLKQN